MGILDYIFNGLLSGSNTSTQQTEKKYSRERGYTPEEFIILDQEKSGETWHGVPLSKLSKLAQTVYHGKYVKIDQYGFLVFYYTSNSNKTKFSVQCGIDDNGQLHRMTYGYYPNQWRDSVDDFIEKANRQFTFK